MRALLQRVRSARVTVADEETGAIGAGLLVFLAVVSGDADADLDWLANKVAHLRIFSDDAGKMNRSVRETGGAVLVVSQFTLAADTRKGLRPGFERAAPPAVAQAYYQRFCARLRDEYELPVATGRFGAMMEVALVNDGPVTFLVDSREGAA